MRTIIYILCSAAILLCAYPNDLLVFGFWPAAWFFAVPFFYALSQSTLQSRLGSGLLFGVVFYALLVKWFIPYSGIGYGCFVAALTAQVVIFAALYREPYPQPWRNGIYVASAWVVSEWLRAFMMRGFSWGLGHSQTFNLTVLQWADLFGSYGLSFVLVVFNYGMLLVIREREERFQNILALMMVAAIVTGYGWWALKANAPATSTPALRIAAVQPNIDYRDKMDYEKVYQLVRHQAALTSEAFDRQVFDLAVWPETAVPADIEEDERLREHIMHLRDRVGVPLLVGMVDQKQGRQYNSAVLINEAGLSEERYYKSKLVPFSEYTPSGKIWNTLQAFFAGEDVGFSSGEALHVFSVPVGRATRSYRLGMLICSEDTIGSLFRWYKKSGADAVVVLLNDSWFNDVTGLVLHAQNAVMRAVEQRLPVARVSNSGWTCVITSQGRIQPAPFNARKQFNRPAVVHLNLERSSRQSLYYILGDTFCGMCGVFVIITLFNNRLSGKRRFET